MLSPVTLAKAILPLAVLQTAAIALPSQGSPPIAELFPARPSGYVTDVAGALDPGSIARINDLVERLRNATGAEIAVAVLPSIGDRAPVDVAVAIGRAWGVGPSADVGDPRRNAGVVMLLVPRRAEDPNSGHIFIASGQGVEGYVTDLQAGRVRDLMVPYFRDRNYGAGLEAGVRELTGLIARGMGVTDTSLTGTRQPGAESGSGSRFLVYLLLALLIALIVIGAITERGKSGPGRGTRGRGRRRSSIFWGGFGRGGGGGGGFGGGFGGGGFGGFGGGGGFSGGGAGGRF